MVARSLTASIARFVVGMVPSLLFRNVVAIMVGRVWAMALSFVLVPVYIHVLGIESYGIIGLYSTLVAVFSLLDFGLSVTINRELSRMIPIAAEHAAVPTLIRTFETLYWLVGLGIGIAIAVLAPFLATSWLHPQHVPVPMLILCVRLIGITIALQWPTGLYGGAIAGLQRFVRWNVVDIVVTTLKGVGGIVVILVSRRSLEAYFLWQVVATGIGLVLMNRLLWRSLPATARVTRPSFSSGVFGSIWRFSAGISSLTILGVVIAQADKVYLSSALPLAVYAEYLVGSAIAIATGLAASIIIPTMLPQFSALVSVGDTVRLQRTYRLCAQWIAVATTPVVAVVAAFAHPIILFWTRNPQVADVAAPVAAILAYAYGFVNLYQVPFVIQVANGSTRISLIVNVAMIAVLIPGLYVTTHAFGLQGAAATLAALSLAQLIGAGTSINRTFLPGVQRAWLTADVAVPLAVATGCAFILRVLMPPALSSTLAFAFAAGAGIITLALTAASAPVVRASAFAAVRRRRDRGRCAHSAPPLPDR